MLDAAQVAQDAHDLMTACAARGLSFSEPVREGANVRSRQWASWETVIAKLAIAGIRLERRDRTPVPAPADVTEGKVLPLPILFDRGKR